MRKGLVVGFSLCLLALVLGGLFFIKSYHEAYWSSPAVFVLMTFLGALSPLVGGFLLGRGLVSNERIISGPLQSFMFTAGVLLTIAGVFLAISAIGMALGVSGTGYWGHPPYEYEGDYVIMRLQIDLFRFAILPELAGGIMLGATMEMRKTK